MTKGDRTTQVLIVGGGVAALELLLALRVHAAPYVAITLLTATPEFAPRAITVAEPFERGGAQTYEWPQIAEHQHARLVIDTVVAVDTAQRIIFTHGGRRLHYDILALTTGARPVDPFVGALTFGARADATTDLRALVLDVLEHDPSSLAFALPSPSSWPLPLYELALLTAHELREHGSDTAVRIVTPEAHPLGLFGPAARHAVEPMFEELGIELFPYAQPRELVAGGLRLHDGEVVAADHVVTLAEIIASPIAGLPSDRLGFVPVNVHGASPGRPPSTPPAR